MWESQHDVSNDTCNTRQFNYLDERIKELKLEIINKDKKIEENDKMMKDLFHSIEFNVILGDLYTNYFEQS